MACANAGAAHDASALVRALQDPEFVRVSADDMGRSLWPSIHNIARAFVATREKQEAARAFVASLAALLPCDKCAGHFQRLAPTVDVSSPLAFLKWTVDTHNIVNARLGKPVLSYEDAVAAMRKPSPPAMLAATAPPPSPAPSPPSAILCPSTAPWIALACALGVLAIVFIVLYALRRRRRGTR